MATRILPEASGASVDDRVRAVVRTLLGAADMSALLAEGEDIRVIQVILGHRSLASTQVYTNPRELHQMGENVQVAC
jgi:integrase